MPCGRGCPTPFSLGGGQGAAPVAGLPPLLVIPCLCGRKYKRYQRPRSSWVYRGEKEEIYRCIDR